MSVSTELIKELLSITHDYQNVIFTKKEWKELKSRCDRWRDSDSIESEINRLLIESGYVYFNSGFYWTKLKINESDFIGWLFDDMDNSDARSYVNKMVKSLLKTGKYKVTGKSLFKECGYIPKNIILGMEDFNIEDYTYLEVTDDEFDPKNCELIRNI